MSEKSLSQKFQEMMTENQSHPYLEFPPTEEDIFTWGYLLAQKDLQQKLDTYIQLAETKGKELEEAREVIAFYANKDHWLNHLSGHGYASDGLIIFIDWENGIRDYDCEVGGKRARAYLEKWK